MDRSGRRQDCQMVGIRSGLGGAGIRSHSHVGQTRDETQDQRVAVDRQTPFRQIPVPRVSLCLFAGL